MKYLLFICALFLCIACEEDKSVDPTIMPQDTTTGENTFGCLNDGWVYVSGRWGTPTTNYYKQDNNTYKMEISAEVDLKSYIKFTILNPEQGKTVDYTEAYFDTQSLEDGKVHITRMSNGIISGTFEGTRITKGRFDLKYRELN